MPPCNEDMQKLRALYAEWRIHSRNLTAVHDRIQEILHAQPDYQDWRNNDGSQDNLPEWIHSLTGGRPYTGPYHTPAVQQRAKKQRKKKSTVDQNMVDVYKNMMKNFTGG